MCSCRGVGPVHAYDHGTTLVGNVLGRSFARTADYTHYYLCDCGASYIASAFSSGLIALSCIVLALLMGVSGFPRKQSFILLLIWASLIGFNFLQHVIDVVSRVPVSMGAGPSGLIREAFIWKFVASVPVQLGVDALLLLIVPAGLAFAVRALMLRSAGSGSIP